jgi:hypothetical protein
MTRPYLVIVAGTVLAVGGTLALSGTRPDALRNPDTMKVEDFGAYWTASRVNLAGGNAYDESQLLAPQQAIEPDRTRPVAAWSPPWTFAAFAPFTPMAFAAARWAWRFVQIATVFAAVTALWRVYGGPPGQLVWAWCAALVWYPTLQMIGLGQHSNLVLLGLVGWLAGLTAGRPFAAGACLALVLVKPQNVYLVGLLVVVWMADRRQWRTAAGAVAGTLAFTSVTLVPNPRVFAQYLDALANRPPSYTVPPTPGMLLRMAFGSEHFWLVFLPPLAGVLWAVWYYARNRAEWDWRERLPVVVLASCLTSPYGWMYDQILFLIPIVAVLAPAARRGWMPRGVAVVAGLSAVCLGLHAAGFREVTFAWHAPLCLGLYLAAGAHLRRHPFSNSA